MEVECSLFDILAQIGTLEFNVSKSQILPLKRLQFVCFHGDHLGNASKKLRASHSLGLWILSIVIISLGVEEYMCMLHVGCAGREWARKNVRSSEMRRQVSPSTTYLDITYHINTGADLSGSNAVATVAGPREQEQEQTLVLSMC